ncbi:hypothetical protein D3C81_2331080 [compost metagenome]
MGETCPELIQRLLNRLQNEPGLAVVIARKDRFSATHSCCPRYFNPVSDADGPAVTHA